MTVRRYELRGFPGWWSLWVSIYDDVEERYTMWKRVAGPFLRHRTARRVLARKEARP